MEAMEISTKRVLAQFKSDDGVLVGVPLDLPVDVNEASLGHLCNTLLGNVRVSKGEKQLFQY